MLRWLLLLPAVLSATGLWVETGYRRDHLRWSIGGGGINILSELTYRDLDVWEARGGFEVGVPGLFCVSLQGGYGYLWDGREQDSDFRGANRGDEFSRSVSHIDGYAADVEVSVGRRHFFFVPRSGFSWRMLYMRAKDGRQVIGGTGSFPAGINSTYRADWYTAFVGLCANLPLLWASVGGEVQVHGGAYLGDGDWRLRPDLDRIRQEAPVVGVVGRIHFFRRLCGGLFLRASVDGQYWIASEGTVHFHRPNGTSTRQPFREARYVTVGGRLALQYQF